MFLPFYSIVQCFFTCQQSLIEANSDINTSLEALWYNLIPSLRRGVSDQFSDEGGSDRRVATFPDICLQEASCWGLTAAQWHVHSFVIGYSYLCCHNSQLCDVNLQGKMKWVIAHAIVCSEISPIIRESNSGANKHAFQPFRQCNKFYHTFYTIGSKNCWNW